MTVTDVHRKQFRALHEDGLFVMPNAWDGASARVMVSSGAVAVATTSSGFAATLGRADYEVTLDELLRHSALLASVAGAPVSVDSERCYGTDPAGVADCVEALAAAGVAGCSIEDYDPASGAIDSIEVAVERVSTAVEVANRHGMVLTARAERHLYEADADFNDTMDRLRRFAHAGAGCIYAPGLTDSAQIAAACQIGPAVNVLLSPATPPIGKLAELGVRRVSTGGALVRSALGEVRRAVKELHDEGTLSYMARAIGGRDFDTILGSKPGS